MLKTSEGTIKYGQSRDTGNIRKKAQQKNMKQKNIPQKAKKMSNTDPLKRRR